MKYRLLDHPADIRLEIFGGDRKTLFENAAFALFDLITDTTRIRRRATQSLTIESPDLTSLFIDWMRELLYLWNGEAKIVGSVAVQSLSDNQLAVLIFYDRFAPARHPVRHEIKAVTYHQAAVRQTPSGWAAHVILDV